jgi:phytol kinase
MISDLGILFLIVGLIAFVTMVMELSIRKEIIPGFIGRKITHMANGVLCVLAIPLMENMATQVVVGAVISLFALYAIKTQWLSMNNMQDYKSGLGIFYFPLSFTILMLMWGKTLEAVSMMSLLIMSFSDSSASLIGRRIGRIEYSLRGGKKTLEGSLAFFMMTVILFYVISISPSFTLPIPDAWNLYQWWASAIIIAVLLTFLEATI